MGIAEFILGMPCERQALLTYIHDIIVNNDAAVKAVVKLMMGKEMILYEDGGVMKYGLASAKNHMSLHCLPMYMTPSLRAKYEPILSLAKFQKGCINFSDEASMPSVQLKSLIVDCSYIDIGDVLEKRKKK